jgi:hypothetical protein
MHGNARRLVEHDHVVITVQDPIKKIGRCWSCHALLSICGLCRMGWNPLDHKPSLCNVLGMSTDKTDEPASRHLTPAARRALAEAAERRAAYEAKKLELAKQAEKNGRGGLDPVRYEDWEVKGIASDFS